MVNVILDNKANITGFLDSLPEDDNDKITSILQLLAEKGYTLGPPHVKKLTGESLFELRVRWRQSFYRLLFFYLGDKAIIVNIFAKRTDNTPQNEIDKARRRMEEIRREFEDV